MTNRDSKLRKYIYLFIFTLENSKIVKTIIVKGFKFPQFGQNFAIFRNFTAWKLRIFEKIIPWYNFREIFQTNHPMNFTICNKMITKSDFVSLRPTRGL